MNLGNVSITAPANGAVHLAVTGYAYLYNNNTVRLGLGTQPYYFDLDSTYAGVYSGGSGTERHYYSMTSQAVYNVMQGNKCTFYATAWRDMYNDAALMTLSNVKLIAVFLAT
jgi:hypothetical protein